MKLEQPITVAEIASLIQAKVIGNQAAKVTHLKEMHKIVAGCLMFVDNEKYYTRAIFSQATAIIIDQEVECPPDKALLIVERPFEAYNQVALHFSPAQVLNERISSTAKIGANTVIEPGAVIGHHVTIGNNCLIRANTVLLDHTKIGNNVIIHANCSIGNDAFYMNKQKDRSYQRWHSIGRVVIEDDVEIGAGCTIDRGVSGDTVIGEGTKIDNLVHIGHGVVIGKHCLLAAQVGIAGKTTVQDHVTIYGQVGISKSLVIGEGATIWAKTGVNKSIPGGNKEYFGIPVGEAKTKLREFAYIRQLPELFKKINTLREAISGKKSRE